MVKGMGWGSVLVGWLAVSAAIGMFHGSGYGFLMAGIGTMVWGLFTIATN